MLKINKITTDLCKRRMVDVLREYVGPGKQWTYETASEALGIDYRAMSSYALGENLPTLTKFFRMCRMFGPNFANRFLHIAGLGGSTRQEVRGVHDFALNADTAHMINGLADALRDGRIDASERAALLPKARQLMDDLQNWIAEHDRLPEEILSDKAAELVNLRPQAARFDA